MNRQSWAGRASVTFAVGLLAACGSGGDGGAPPKGGARALFELPRPGAPAPEFYALPFPTDLRRHPDGSVDLDGHPRPGATGAFLDAFAGTDGFGTSQAVFFRFDAPIEVRSLPASGAESVAATASVYLVDVDDASPERGRRVPLRYRFEDAAGATIGPHWLSCLPLPGFPLRPLTTYAAVVTRRLRATDGTPVQRGPDFEALAGSGGDAAVAAARPAHAPLLAWLDEPGGDERADVISAAVYTTRNPTPLVGRARTVVLRDFPTPVASDLTELPSTAAYTLWEGTYPGPSFQIGAPPYVAAPDGEIRVDAGGEPIFQRMETIPFAVAFPTGTTPASGWPVAIFAHGTGGDHMSFVSGGVAEALAAEGIASISIDAPLHGARDPGDSPPGSLFFNLANPVAGRDNARQAAIDGFQLVRLVTSLPAPAPGASLDPDRVFFVGHSQGAITGVPFLAHEPLIGGAVLAGGGGPFGFLAAHKKLPSDVAEVLGNLFGDPDLDEFNDMLALLQMFEEPADPMSYASRLVRDPPGGASAKDVLVVEGIDDGYVLDESIAALAVALGAAPATPVLEAEEAFALANLEPLDPPISANAGGRTAVLVQRAAAPGSEAHFVLFDDGEVRRRYARFLASLAESGVATLEP